MPVTTNDNAPVYQAALTELEQTRNVIEGVFAALPCGVAIVKPDYEVIDANPAYFKPLGLARSEVHGRHCHEVFNRYPNPCSMLSEACPIAAARTTGGVGRVCREHRLPDGRVRNLEYTANPMMDEHGSISAYVLVVSDLTSLREAEERLEKTRGALAGLDATLSNHHEEQKESARQLAQANAEMVKLSRARSEFIAAVSQELRTPLAAISEGVGLVEDGTCGALNANQQTFLHLAGKNTKRLADMLNDLLDLSKLEAGRLEVHRRRLDLSRIARATAIAYDGIARGNHQTLKVDLPEGLEPVLADEESVLRILNNLVGNAVKFTSAGGTITITADRLRTGGQEMGTKGPGAQGFRPEPQNLGSRFAEAPASTPEPLSYPAPMIAVSVSDTGSGIPGDEQSRLSAGPEPPPGNGNPKSEIRNPNPTVSDLELRDSSFPRGVAPFRGAGLGIALSRQLVEMNGGRFWSESRDGTGSRFSFTLPVYTEFAGLSADLRYFAAAVADERVGMPAVYCFRVRPGKEGNGLLPRLEELLTSLFPKPATLSATDSGRGILVFVPRKLPELELQPIIGSLKGASLSAGRQKPDVRLQFGMLDYDQLRLRLHALTAGRPEPDADSAARWWNTLFDELQPGLEELL